MHTRAFGEMHFLIYGQDPLVPMKLEQTFAQARPSDEIQFDSFENYDQAYDFAKDNKNVGLVFMLENCGEMDLNSVFKQFSKQSENQDVCFGVLIHNGQESFKGLRAMKDNDQFIAYYDVNDLLDADKAPFLLKEIWEKYQDAYEKLIIPSVMAETYRNLALLHLSEEDLSFRQRCCNLLTGEMNVTWKEGFALKWFPTLEILAKNESDVLNANKALQEIYDSISSSHSSQNLTEIANSESSIATKITTAVLTLATEASKNNLDAFLNEQLKEVSPRSKAILRTLKKSQARIMEFQESSSSTIRRLKVV